MPGRTMPSREKNVRLIFVECFTSPLGRPRESASFYDVKADRISILMQDPEQIVKGVLIFMLNSNV